MALRAPHSIDNPDQRITVIARSIDHAIAEMLVGWLGAERIQRAGHS